MLRSDSHRDRSSIATLGIAAAVIAASLLAGTASADRAPSPADEILAPPPTYEAGGVTVVERLGTRVPVDAKFRTLDGNVVALGEVLRGELPTILTFNYADCPMLCSLQLNGLTAALPAISAVGPAPSGAAPGDVVFRIGTQFRIVTIDLEPTESLDRLAKMRDRYIAKLPEAQREAARAGWTFLAAETPGDGAAIGRVAEAVGFKYVYIKDRAEWAHPAALIFLSTTGAVTRYVYGIEFDPQVMRESIFKAGLAEPSTAVGFMNRCYHFDPDAKNHSRSGMLALRVGAAGFLVLLLAGFGLYFVRRHGRRTFPDVATPGSGLPSGLSVEELGHPAERPRRS